MSFSYRNASAFSDSRTRSDRLTPCSGMCSLCMENCPGTCEIGLSAVLGKAMVYPTTTGSNQVASEKNLPVGFSDFNINGRCFGALGVSEDPDIAAIFNVGLERTIGKRNPIKLAVPFTLPALIKLNWRDYFSAAAMIGTVCVIGEGSPSRDPNVEKVNGRIVRFDMLNEMLDCFRKYYRGYGQIVLQCNLEDLNAGLAEFGIEKCGVQAIEFKFGQSAKGTQPASRMPSFEAALAKKKDGYIVRPDPDDPIVREQVENGNSPVFWSFSRLPMWTEGSLRERIDSLRKLGMKNVYFKTAGFDPEDLKRILLIASELEVDMVTFDGASGGSGYSPSKMMNEFGLPAVCIESAILPVCRELEAKGKYIPSISITGGFAAEDQAFKALAFGAPYVAAVGLCRATMAAAMVGKFVGQQTESGSVPAHLKRYGATVEELFLELPEVRAIYGKNADISLGAVGAYSYLRKMAFGVQHFAALNRKFDVSLLGREDLIPLTNDARLLLQGKWFNY